ncbi:MAG: hypothetical protein ACREBD_06305 [Blastocatellia bacterium]
MNKEKLTVEEARLIAEQEFNRILATSVELQQYHFDPVMYCRETDLFWTFVAGSEELIELGYVPGAIHISVDKLDGHVWTPEEMERLALERERMKRGAQAVV